MTSETMAAQRLSLGLPLLLFAPFQGKIEASPPSPPRTAPPATIAEPGVETEASLIPGGAIAEFPVAIPPEQPAANESGEALDQEIG
jgi:hypothetical protein